MNIKLTSVTKCRVCGSTNLTWNTAMTNPSGIAQGRLTTRDVGCVFFLGCDQCSETLVTVTADKVASVLNAAARRPSMPTTADAAFVRAKGEYDDVCAKINSLKRKLDAGSDLASYSQLSVLLDEQQALKQRLDDAAVLAEQSKPAARTKEERDHVENVRVRRERQEQDASLQ